MPATVIAERLEWSYGLTILKDRVRALRPYYLPPDPASRTEYDPGHRVQCDLWFPPALVPLGAGQAGSPPVLVMTSGYSRMRWALMCLAACGAAGCWSRSSGQRVGRHSFARDRRWSVATMLLMS
jgi:hypothetical protein